jgi:DNA polymerase III epsilon subunit-like protein
MIRDTSSLPSYKKDGNRVSLKKLALEHLDLSVQVGRKGHCAVEDAQTTMSLYLLRRDEFEEERQ